jgi:hypothetical protein
MITENNTYTINVPEIFSKAAATLLSRQAAVAGKPSVKKTGYLAGYLATSPYTIDAQEDSTTLTITYPAYLRHIDKSTRKGKVKKKVSIYNRLVYGMMRGYIYNRLRGGLALWLVRRIQKTEIKI